MDWVVNFGLFILDSFYYRINFMISLGDVLFEVIVIMWEDYNVIVNLNLSRINFYGN